MEALTNLYNHAGFNEVWEGIGAEIKIRKFDQLDNIPEFRKLSNGLKEEINKFHDGLNFNYETFYDNGYFYSSALIVLIDKEKENWVGWFQYDYTTGLAKLVATLLGLGICIGGVCYFWPVASKHVSSLVGYISKNYKEIQDHLIQCAGDLLSLATYVKFVQWLLSSHCPSKILIAACILKKLHDIRRHQTN